MSSLGCLPVGDCVEIGVGGESGTASQHNLEREVGTVLRVEFSRYQLTICRAALFLRMPHICLHGCVSAIKRGLK